MLLLFNDSMKQTITTQNYRATVDIPIQKLTRPCNQKRINTNEQSNRDTVITLQGCSCQRECAANTNEVTIQMLQQLELAYEKDMKEMRMKVGRVEQKHDEMEMQLKQKLKDVQNMRKERENDKLQFLRKTKDMEIENKRLESEIERGKKQRDNILKSKISEFQNQNMVNELKNEEKLRAMKQQVDGYWEERMRRKEVENSMSSAALQQKIAQYAEKLQSLNAQYQESQNWLMALQKSQQKLKVGIQTYMDTVQDLQNIIGQNKKQISVLTQQVNSKTQELSVKGIEIGQVLKKVTQMSLKIQELNKVIVEVEDKYKEGIKVNTQLQQQFLSAKSHNGQLHQTIMNLNRLIGEKESLIRQKDEKKVYEVKIQKVIERQDYIKELEASIQKYKAQIYEKCEKIKQYQRNQEVQCGEAQRLKAEVSSLKVSIIQLKGYIQEKQKSFAWIVERQISKDIRINEHQKNNSYKVYPMKFVQQSSLPEHSSNQQQFEKVQGEKIVFRHS